jgi:redox-sensitive bicupin YhaK (pirin superfamily)
MPDLLRLQPRVTDLAAGLQVRRVLPAARQRSVGPHPHIGLATVQEILPGALNWMSAGRGIVHSERTPPDPQGQARRLHGLQLWVALPAEQEEGDPAFQHVPAGHIPAVREQEGLRCRREAGRLGSGPALGPPVGYQPAVASLTPSSRLRGAAGSKKRALASFTTTLPA